MMVNISQILFCFLSVWFQLERLSCDGCVRPTSSSKSRTLFSSGTFKTCTMLKNAWKQNWAWTRRGPRLFTNTCWPLSTLWSTVCRQCLCQVSSHLPSLRQMRKMNRHTHACDRIHLSGSVCSLFSKCIDNAHQFHRLSLICLFFSNQVRAKQHHLGTWTRTWVVSVECWRETLKNIVLCSPSFAKSSLTWTGNWYIPHTWPGQKRSEAIIHSICSFLSRKCISYMCTQLYLVMPEVNPNHVYSTMCSARSVLCFLT